MRTVGSVGRIVATAPPAPAVLVQEWRDRGRLTDERIGWCLERAAAQWPDRPAVVADGVVHTFADLRVRADALATALLAAGVGAGDVVTWTLPNGVDAIAVAAAVWRIGAVNNPVVAIYREHELSFVLDQLRPAAVVTTVAHRGRGHADEFGDVLASIGHRPQACLVTGGKATGWKPVDDLATSSPLPAGIEPAAADEPCLVLYTSGTTASPKGAVHSSAALLQEVRSMQREWGLTWRDVMFMASPLTHITGLLQGLLVPTAMGARSVLLDRWDPEEAVSLIEAEGATYMAGATPFLQGVLDEYGRRGVGQPSLRQFCCGGAAVPPHLVEEADAIGLVAYRCWGMTEFPTTTLASENDPLDRRATTDGHRAEAVEVEAVDEDRQPLAPGTEGELRVRGPERMLGYADPEVDPDAIDQDGWFYTGDLGVVDDDGYVRITGRRKDVINRGGEKFSAREIEDLLAQHPSVAAVAVVGVPGGRLGERVCAAVVGRDGAVDVAQLRTFLENHRIAKQKIPEEFRVVDDLPRTAAGKVQKFRLVAAWDEPHAEPAPEPGTPVPSSRAGSKD
jgi:acyl-CoA synthetase (AMP-forming)/AMP-acid ligase II